MKGIISAITETISTRIYHSLRLRDCLRIQKLFKCCRSISTKYFSGRVHQLTSGIRSLNLYCDGKKLELVIAARKRGGNVLPPLATTCCSTDPAPADSPHIVTLLGSPPN